ncbi:MAG: MmcQ-like protein [Bacteroidetes bacterium GWF2_43_63]|nr:MAG: MmcQ-like protein [Bacteroidetes bacterium GWE2_42_42]OFY55196.1 MAG: MmcQ-like protein [Bacteroidetes bacterium GWF2_43_63]HBG70927.1 MmcQ-like protein [Bacteroidales bacterium]HCB63309.1 MmcQ-like protein [Bacteroidales bacterium]HCY23011.1 MmcQ-like protein [Bacteroidales bacterium]
MNIETFREYCLLKPGVTEEFPFDETTLVFKVGGKMFALTDIEGEFTIALKCDPEYSIELQERHSSITPAYHMSKIHWIDVNEATSFDEKLLKQLIDGSYDLVYKGLTKKVKDQISNRA